jgi:hypothetical protein
VYVRVVSVCVVLCNSKKKIVGKQWCVCFNLGHKLSSIISCVRSKSLHVKKKCACSAPGRSPLPVLHGQGATNVVPSPLIAACAKVEEVGEGTHQRVLKLEGGSLIGPGHLRRAASPGMEQRG